MKRIKRLFTQKLEQRLKGRLNFIQVVMGPRQVGKTTGLQQIIRTYKGPSLMVTADDVASPNTHWLETQWQRARTKGDGCLLVIDEIQKIPNWSLVVKRLFDEQRSAKKMNIVLLGSASLSLQQGLGESLAGRYEIVHADHWSFQECKDAFKWNLNEYLKFGGYPAAAELTSDSQRWQFFIKNSIIEPVLGRDILGLTSINKPALFRHTFYCIMAYPAQEISLQKILGQLQENGNVTTIKHYLNLFEGAFLIRVLQKYSGSDLKKRNSSPKILPLNNALIHAFQKPESIDLEPQWYGHVFEATVGAYLNRLEGNLYYWRDGKYEVDFVYETSDKKKVFAIEVKSGRKKNEHGLSQFTKKYGEKIIPAIITRKNVNAFLTSSDPEAALDRL